MAQKVTTNVRPENWKTKHGVSKRIVTRTSDGKFYDNVSLRALGIKRVVFYK